MPDNQETATGNATSVQANWAALEELSDVVIKQEAAPEVKDEVEKPETQEVNIDTEKKEEKTEEKKEEVKDEKTEEKKEENPDSKTEETEKLEFKIDDIQDVPEEYQDGTFKFLAKELGADIKEESFDAFKEAFVPRAELDKVKNLTFDSLLSDLKPEAAAAIKLMQMGYSEEQIVAPTRQIDEYLRLDDAAIVRADLESQLDSQGKPLYTQEIIDHDMEAYASDPGKLKIVADKLRIMLREEKNQVLAERQHYIQKFEQDRQAAIYHKKEQEKANLINAVNNVSSFLDIPVSKEVQDAIVRKINNGLYDGELSNPKRMAELLYHIELGQKAAKHLQNKAFEKGKSEVTKKLLNVPPVTNVGGKKVDVSSQPNDNPWSALDDFKN